MQEYLFDDRDEASVAAAHALAGLIGRRLAAQGEASLVVSGGTTPGRCFAELAATDLDWPHVDIVLSDERWVPPESDDSNERLVRESLLTGRAAGATLLPVYRPGTTPEARCEAMAEEIQALPFPFAAALLGMGEDGHFASLFPDAANLDEGLDTDSAMLCLPVATVASPHPRVSLSLAALSRSDEIVLLIFGEAKRSVIEAARKADNALPIARLLRQKRAPVNVYWAP